LTVGERDPYKIFFSVYDVSKELEMPNLQKIITNKDKKGYMYGAHYVYFFMKNNKNKKLFLTFYGFQRMISISKCAFTNKYKSIFLKWLYDKFGGKKLQRYYAEKMSHQERTVGYTYCAWSDLLDGIKIGNWGGTICGLRSRYITYYGNGLQLFYVLTKDAAKLEKLCHEKFKAYNITNELFKKEYLSEYQEFLTENKEELDIEPETDDTKNSQNIGQYKEKPIITDKIIDIKIIDNKVVDNKIIDNKVVDNNVVENKIVNNKIIDNKIVDNKIVDNKIVDNKIINWALNFEYTNKYYGEQIILSYKIQIEQIKTSYEAEIEKLKTEHKHENELLISKHENERIKDHYEIKLREAEINAKNIEIKLREAVINAKNTELKLRESEIVFLNNKLDNNNPIPIPKTKPMIKSAKSTKSIKNP